MTHPGQLTPGPDYLTAVLQLTVLNDDARLLHRIFFCSVPSNIITLCHILLGSSHS